MKERSPQVTSFPIAQEEVTILAVYCKTITICGIFNTADTHLCSSRQIELFLLLMQWVMTQTHKCHLTAIKCTTLVIALQLNENRC